MAELVYLKNALGNSQAYTVENGVKLSDGAGGWVPFRSGTGGNSIIKAVNGTIRYNDSSKTQAQQTAILEQTSVSITLPTGTSLVGYRAIGMQSAGSAADGDFVLMTAPLPVGAINNQDSECRAVVTVSTDQSGNTVVTAGWKDTDIGFCGTMISQNRTGYDAFVQPGLILEVYYA